MNKYRGRLDTKKMVKPKFEYLKEDEIDYMIHTIAKVYGVTITQAREHTMLDYNRLRIFNNIDALNQTDD